MLDPSVGSDAIVEMLRSIPGLVTELNGDATNISAYHDEFPGSTCLQDAIYRMAVPSILVAWSGSGPGSIGRNEWWKHRYTAYLRPRDAEKGIAKLWKQMIDGVPTKGVGQKMLLTEPHESLARMDVPSIQRVTLVIDGPTAINMDIFQVSLVFPEKGDY